MIASPTKQKSSWKRKFILAAICFTGILVVSFILSYILENAITKSLPAPIQDDVEQVMIGRVNRFWGGDNFEFGDANELHYLVIRGISSPKSGQKYYVESVKTLSKILRGKDIQIEVVARDDMMREISDVFIYQPDSKAEQYNVGLEMIRLGQAWYNGMKFKGWEDYAEAQKTARENRFGLWKQDTPVAPWDFSEARQQAVPKLKL
ncbi:MAG: thermonuclease family protein [Mariniblastus sp.]